MRWSRTLVATSLGFAVVQLDVSVVNVAIQPIGAALGGGTSALQWVVNAYTIAFAAFILTAGALGDRIGAKRVLVAGFALFTAASVACGLAPGLGALIAARAVQGVGAAILVPCSLSVLSHAYPDPDERARAVGLWAAGASVALSAGPLVGGVLTAAFGWRAIFFINLPLGLFAIALAVRHAPETSRSPERGVDVPGQLAAVAGLGTLAAATIEGGQRGFGDPVVLAGFATALALGAAFIAIERSRRDPMLPLELFRKRAFSGPSAVGLSINIAYYGLIFVLSLFFQREQHLSALQTGLAFAPMTVAVMVTNIYAGRLASARTVMTAGALVMAAGLAALLGLAPGTGYGAIVAQLVAIGAGVGAIVPAMTSTMLASVDQSRAGVASGTLNTARQTGSVIGVALFGSLGAVHAALAVSVALALAAAGFARV